MTRVASEKGALTSSDFFFPTPSTLYGIARLVDIGAQLDSFNTSLTPEEADFLALYFDLCMVGKDFRAALKQCRHENHETLDAAG